MPQILLTQIVDRDKEVQNILALKFGPGEVYILGNFNDKTNFQRVSDLSIVKSVDTATNNLNCELVINPYVSPSSKNCSLGIETQIPSPTTGSKKGYVNDLSKSQVDQNIAAMQALSDFVGTSAVSKIRTNTFDSSYQLYFTPDNSVGKKKFSSDNKYQDFATTATQEKTIEPEKDPEPIGPEDPEVGPEIKKEETNHIVTEETKEPEKEVKPVETEKKPEEEKEPTTPPVSPAPPTPETESSESRSGETPGDGVGITAGGGPGGGSSGPSSETGDTIIVPPPAGPSTPSTSSTPTEEHEDGKTVDAASTGDGKPDKPAKAKDKEKSAPAPSKGKDKKESILGPLGFILIAAAVFLCLLAPFLAMSTLLPHS